ncbi:MAG: hypothetical protein O7D86_12160 [Proteobacteria bacterium]|nr:hypothetical protein [Pseudomonadota bacterium]
MVKTIMGLSTASLLLPVFLAREFLGIDNKTPLINVLGCSIYWAWALLAISILSGIFFIYLSAKSLRIAWGKKAGVFLSTDTPESTVESLMCISFWLCVFMFGTGLSLTVFFFVSYANGL